MTRVQPELTETLPRLLYRYRAWDTSETSGSKHGQDILKKKELFFPRASSLNDPFEGRIPIRYDLVEEQEFEEILFVLAKADEKMKPDNEPERSDADLRAEVTSIAPNHPFRQKNREARWDALEKYCDAHDSNYGLLSFSSSYSDMLQWAHYGDMHRGYCVELDTIVLRQLFVDVHAATSHDKFAAKFMGPYPIEYTRAFPLLTPNNRDTDSLYRRRYTTKSYDWRYEKEYRCIAVGGANETLRFNSELVTGVFLGCNISAEHKREIVDLTRDQFPRAKLVQAKRARSSFSLDFEPVD